MFSLLDCTDKLNVDAIAARIASLQLPDGSFTGDEFGEVDTRFSYIAIIGSVAVVQTVSTRSTSSAL